ncbi:MAG: hypothetical protein WHS83_16825 [Chloroflexus sp.]|uniref:hypothetical protein n=1 Tax=Chloroflexus TaxID=1107 RepID=UPI0012FE934D|nr:hypothetical protein [Chloroflexus aurantiacus]
MAAALQTARHAHDERVRHSIQHVLARLGRHIAAGPGAGKWSSDSVQARTWGNQTSTRR